jgi:NADH-quinone oxidoreductase subunit C
MDATTLLGILQPLVPGASFEPVSTPDCPTFVVPREHIVEICRALRDAPELGFSCLADVTAVDFHPREPRFEVVYQLICLGVPDLPRPGSVLSPARVRLKVRLAGESAQLPSVSGVYPNANWAEREVFDLFGIVFDGHPDLRRILMPDDWEGHPLRRDYPVQVNVPYKTQELLQMSEEEFVANVTRHRMATRPARKPS